MVSIYTVFGTLMIVTLLRILFNTYIIITEDESIAYSAGYFGKDILPELVLIIDTISLAFAII
jgi:hypothetical protein